MRSLEEIVAMNNRGVKPPPEQPATETKRATEEDCLVVVQRCALAARAFLDIDIPAVLREVEYFESFAPLLDPSLWISNRESSREKQELLEAALPLWRWAQKQKRMREGNHEN